MFPTSIKRESSRHEVWGPISSKSNHSKMFIFYKRGIKPPNEIWPDNTVMTDNVWEECCHVFGQSRLVKVSNNPTMPQWLLQLAPWKQVHQLLFTHNYVRVAIRHHKVFLFMTTRMREDTDVNIATFQSVTKRLFSVKSREPSCLYKLWGCATTTFKACTPEELAPWTHFLRWSAVSLTV